MTRTMPSANVECKKQKFSVCTQIKNNRHEKLNYSVVKLSKNGKSYFVRNFCLMSAEKGRHVLLNGRLVAFFSVYTSGSQGRFT
jgi:hypothetical protein